jgi:hypothetical protein
MRPASVLPPLRMSRGQQQHAHQALGPVRVSTLALMCPSGPNPSSLLPGAEALRDGTATVLVKENEWKSFTY